MIFTCSECLEKFYSKQRKKYCSEECKKKVTLVQSIKCLYCPTVSKNGKIGYICRKCKQTKLKRKVAYDSRYIRRVTYSLDLSHTQAHNQAT